MKLRLPRKLIPALGVMLLLLGIYVASQSPPAAQAQEGGTLTYGASAFGSITPQAPMQLYSFSGTQGDLVEVHMRVLSSGLLPFVDLLAPDRQIIAQARQDSFATNIHDVQITFLLPQTGAYSLITGGTDNTTGDYMLELDGRGAPDRVPLVFGQALVVTVEPYAVAQYFSFDADICPTMLAVLNPSEGLPYTYPFNVKVRDPRGQFVGVLRGGDALEDRVTVAPQSGSYEVEVWSDNPELSGALTLLVTCAMEPQQCLSGEDVATEDPVSVDLVCPECPPCPADVVDDPLLCDAFSMAVDSNTDGVVSLSWPEVEGANAAIVSAVDAEGTLVYARMVTGVLTDVIDFPEWGAGSGIYTVRVSVGAEDSGYNLCADSMVVTVAEPADDDPVPADDDECFVDIVAPRATMANGLQTFFWTDVPGAESYRLRIYGEFDAVVADGAISAPATSMTLDASEAAIGPGYSGSSDFYIQIDALRDGDRWCANGVRVTRSP